MNNITQGVPLMLRNAQKTREPKRDKWLPYVVVLCFVGMALVFVVTL